MKRCPRCGGNKFFTTGIVEQDWLVDENGNFEECSDPCTEVFHFPDDGDIWDCANCGFSAAGRQFNVKEEAK